MSELVVLRRPRPPAIVPPLLSFAAGFIDSFTVLALFGLFVAQVTDSFLARFPALSGRFRRLLTFPRTQEMSAFFAFRLFPGAFGRIPTACLPDGDP